MADHYCEFTVQSPTDENEHIPCGSPAPLKRGGGWYCAYHFDLIERAIALVREVLSGRS